MFKYFVRFVLVVCIILLPACQLKNKDKSTSILPQKPNSSSLRIEETKVALLLPLTGNAQKLGRAMSEMAELSLLNANNPQIKLLIYDTTDNIMTAQNITREAINKGAKLIIGPVFSQATMAIKDVAINNKINLISFSNDPSLENQGIFTLGFSFDAQIRKIAQYTLSKGINQFYTLLPANSYGRNVAEILRDTVISNEGNVVKTEFYTNNIDELEIAVESVVTAIKNNLSSQENTPNRQALFIPEGGNQLKSILKLLSKHQLDFNQIQLLGTGQWDDYDTLVLDQLNGAWFAGSYTKERKLLEEMFNKEYGYIPPRLSILAYDAVSLASVLVKKQSFNKETLINKNGFRGIDGIFRFNNNGNTERNLDILTIADNHLQVIEPASVIFND